MQIKLSRFYTRGKRKLLKLLCESIYYNYAYQPKGIYHTSKEYIVSIENKTYYREVYPQLETKLTISQELYKACSDYIKPPLQVKATYIIVEIPQGRIHTDNAISVAVISHSNKLIADVSFSYKYGKVVSAYENSIFKQKYFIKPEKYKGTIFTLLTGGSGIDNYFHWLVDVLPRLHLLKVSGLFDKVDWFLVPAYKHDFQKQTLEFLGIGKEKIIEGDKHTHIEADTIIASSAPRSYYSLIPLWICEFLRGSFLQHALFQRRYPSFIYISRKDSMIRKVINEGAISTLVEKYGFHTFILSKLSFIEQVCLFASAQVILAPHGAGLINLVFCKKDTQVIEFFAEGYVKPSYGDLSTKVQVRHTYLICKSFKAKTVKQGMKLNIDIDLKQLQAALDRMLVKGSIS